jgi:hypothetical protein
VVFTKVNFLKSNGFGSWIFTVVDFLRLDFHVPFKSSLYWYRGVTALLPGWVIWKYWNCPCKFLSFGSWLVSALSTPNGGEGYNSSTDLNPDTVTLIQIKLQCIQAASPHLADKTTSKPQPKCCMYKFSSSTSIFSI